MGFGGARRSTNLPVVGSMMILGGSCRPIKRKHCEKGIANRKQLGQALKTALNI